jgi:hypothetical protein
MDGYTKVEKKTGKGGDEPWFRDDTLFSNNKIFYYLTVDVPGKVYGSDCHLKPLGNYYSYHGIFHIIPKNLLLPAEGSLKGIYMKTHKYTFYNGEVPQDVYEVVEDNSALKTKYYSDCYNKGGLTGKGNSIEAPVLFLSNDNLYTKNPEPAGGSNKRKQRKTGRKRKSKRTKTNKKVYKR